MVSSRLSSKTELRDSIHSGSISPSHTIQDRVSRDSITTFRDAAVKTPSYHSRVSISMYPSNCSRFMALGFITYCGMLMPSFCNALRNTFRRVDLPDPEGPTMTTPIRWFRDSYSCITLCSWPSSTCSCISSRVSFTFSVSSSYAISSTFTPGNISRTSSLKRLLSAKVNLERVLIRRDLITSDASQRKFSSFDRLGGSWPSARAAAIFFFSA
mmetsp:Transcript_52218/g.93175  ORF Transcript_52218/g.93175 Transcript_52218/m.93175 type:complete len:213 (+) Transcript_52218:6864-7502(+)